MKIVVKNERHLISRKVMLFQEAIKLYKISIVNVFYGKKEKNFNHKSLLFVNKVI